MKSFATKLLHQINSKEPVIVDGKQKRIKGKMSNNNNDVNKSSSNGEGNQKKEDENAKASAIRQTTKNTPLWEWLLNEQLAVGLYNT